MRTKQSAPLSSRNMVTKNMSVDLGKKGIAVCCINPRMVQTAFGPGAEAMKGMGAIPVDESVEGLVKAADQLTLENNHGKFLSVPKERGTDPVEFPGGW